MIEMQGVRVICNDIYKSDNVLPTVLIGARLSRTKQEV